MAGLANGQQEGMQGEYEMEMGEHTHGGIAIRGDLEVDLRMDEDEDRITLA